MKCMDCGHCIEDFTLNGNVLLGTGQFYCQIQNQLHYIGNQQELPVKRCMHRFCVKCGQPDPRIGAGRDFCTECVKAIPKEPEEPFNVSKINWSKIIEVR